MVRLGKEAAEGSHGGEERSASRISLAPCLGCEYDSRSTTDKTQKVAKADTPRSTAPTIRFYVKPFVKTGSASRHRSAP